MTLLGSEAGVGGRVNEERVKALLNEAASYIGDFYAMNGVYPGLRLIAARYSRALRTAGIGLKEALRGDGRFSLIMKSSGSYEVRVAGVTPMEVQVQGLLKERPRSFGELSAEFRGSGLKVSHLMDAVSSLVVAGIVVLENEVYSLKA